MADKNLTDKTKHYVRPVSKVIVLVKATQAQQFVGPGIICHIVSILNSFKVLLVGSEAQAN